MSDFLYVLGKMSNFAALKTDLDYISQIFVFLN